MPKAKVKDTDVEVIENRDSESSDGGFVLGGTIISETGSELIDPNGKVKLIMLSGTVGGRWYGFNLDYIKYMTDGLGVNDTAMFFINSGGGYIPEGLSILNYIQLLPCNTVALVSYSASMATQIAVACNEVYTFEQSIFMIHNAQGGAYGDYKAVRKTANLLEQLNKMLAVAYTNKTNKSMEDVISMMEEDTYIMGNDIKNHGFADGILKISPNELISKTADVDDDVAKMVEMTENPDSESENKDNAPLTADLTTLKSLTGEVVNKQLEHTNSDVFLETFTDNLKECTGNCTMLKNDNNQDDKIKISKTKTGEVEMSKVKDTDVDPQNTISETDLQTAVTNALNKEKGRVGEIMAIAGISDYMKNETISAMLADGTSTANDVKASMYDVLKNEVESKVDSIKNESKDASKKMLDIDNDATPPANTDITNDDTLSLLTDEEKALVEENQITLL